MSGLIGQVGARSGVVGSTTDSTQLDYEEGTFTPVVSVGGVPGSGDDKTSECTVNGFYIKIGDMVQINVNIQIGGSGLSGSGFVYAGNFPFNASSSTNYISGGSVLSNRVSVSQSMPLGVRIDAGTNHTFFHSNKNADTSSGSGLQQSGCTGGTSLLQFTLTYQTS